MQRLHYIVTNLYLLYYVNNVSHIVSLYDYIVYSFPFFFVALGMRRSVQLLNKNFTVYRF